MGDVTCVPVHVHVLRKSGGCLTWLPVGWEGLGPALGPRQKASIALVLLLTGAKELKVAVFTFFPILTNVAPFI